MARAKPSPSAPSSATIGFEAKLWLTAELAVLHPTLPKENTNRGDITIYGQESNATTRRLAVMNPALRGIEADFSPAHAAPSAAPSAATYLPTSAPTPRYAGARISNCKATRPVFGAAKANSSPTRLSTAPTGSARTTTCAGSSASRPRATPTSPGCCTSSTTSRPHRGRPRGLHGRPPRPDLLQHANP